MIPSVSRPANTAASHNPARLSLALTDRCNLDCFFCGRESYLSGTKLRDLPFSDIEAQSGAISDASRVFLCGYGEPTLHRQFDQILNYILSVNPRTDLIEMVTNGTRLSSDLARTIDGRIAHIDISVNAATAETYWRDMHPRRFADGRDMRDRFDHLLKGIADFAGGLSACDRAKLEFHYVVHVDNYREMSQFVRLAAEAGIRTIWFKHMMVRTLDDLDRAVCWVKDDYNAELDAAQAAADALGVNLQYRKFFIEPAKDINPERDCTAVLNNAIVNVDGKIYPCSYGAPSLGTVGEGDVTRAWSGAAFEQFRLSRNSTMCRSCPTVVTFDNVDCHLANHIILTPEYANILADLREVAEENDRDLKLFQRQGLDMDVYRAAFAILGKDVAQCFDARDRDALSSLDRYMWDLFCRTDRLGAAPALDVDFTRPFIGVGWGLPGHNKHGQRWRWLRGGMREAAVFLRLEKGREYSISTRVHTTSPDNGLSRLQISANGVPLSEPTLEFQADGSLRHTGRLPIHVVKSSAGYVRVQYTLADTGSGDPELGWALTGLNIVPRPVTRRVDLARQRLAKMFLDHAPVARIMSRRRLRAKEAGEASRLTARVRSAKAKAVLESRGMMERSDIGAVEQRHRQAPKDPIVLGRLFRLRKEAGIPLQEDHGEAALRTQLEARPGDAAMALRLVRALQAQGKPIAVDLEKLALVECLRLVPGDAAMTSRLEQLRGHP